MNSTGTNKDRKRLVLNDFLWKPYECSYECSSFASVCVCVCAGVFVSKANALFFVKKKDVGKMVLLSRFGDPHLVQG